MCLVNGLPAIPSIDRAFSVHSFSHGRSFLDELSGIDPVGLGCPEGLRSAPAYQRSWQPLWPVWRPCAGTMMTRRHSRNRAVSKLLINFGSATANLKSFESVGPTPPPITLVTLSGEHGRNTLNVSVTKQAPRCFAADVARSRRTIRSSARSVGSM